MPATASQMEQLIAEIKKMATEKAKTTNDIEEVNELIKKLKFETSLEGYIFVKDVALKFFKQQNSHRKISSNQNRSLFACFQNFIFLKVCLTS